MQKSICDRLIVGVSTDDLVHKMKKKTPIVPFDERIEIVRSMKYVDATVPQESMDKYLISDLAKILHTPMMKIQHMLLFQYIIWNFH